MMLCCGVGLSNSHAAAYRLQADEIFFDDISQEFRAIGNVALDYQGKKLYADRIFYDPLKKIIQTSGNVIYQDGALTLFAHEIDFDSELNRYEIETVALQLGQHGRLRANRFNAESETSQSLHYVIYSPCQACFTKAGKEKKPLWQIRSRTTIIDSKKKSLSHDDLYFDVKGKTLLYLPALRHVYDARAPLSGILSPTYGYNKTVGTYYAQPFYYRISSSKDMTILPVYSDQSRHYLSTEYRTALRRGVVASHITFAHRSLEKNENMIPALGQDDTEKQTEDYVFFRSKFNKQISKQTRISGNVNYVNDVKFFKNFRQNTDFNSHGVSAPDYYQDQLLVEQFLNRDYVRFNFRYQHYIDPKTEAVFPVNEIAYHGGLYRLWGGIVNFDGRGETLKRTAIHARGRQKIISRASYQKDFILRNLTFSVAGKLYANQDEERNHEDDAQINNDLRYPARLIQNYYSRLKYDFNVSRPNYVLGFRPEIMSHHTVGNAKNHLFQNMDTREFLPDSYAFLAFEPLGNGEDIQQVGRRVGAGAEIYYQHANGLFANLHYARAQITHDRHDNKTKEVLKIYEGKSDHAALLNFAYRRFYFSHNALFRREDKQVLTSNSHLSMSNRIVAFNLNHDTINDSLFLSPEERARRIRKKEIDKITESVTAGIGMTLSQFWTLSASALYDRQKKEFQDLSRFNLIRKGDCVNFEVSFTRDYTDPKQVEDNIEFKLRLVN